MGRKRKIQTDFDKSSLLYFNDIGGFKPLSREEELDLWKKYKTNNDLNARDKLLQRVKDSDMSSKKIINRYLRH